MICSEGYRRLQELDGKRRETMIYTGSACRKVTAPYVQSGVDSILRPALFVVLRGILRPTLCRPLDLYRDLEVFVVCSCVDADLGTPALLYIV